MLPIPNPFITSHNQERSLTMRPIATTKTTNMLTTNLTPQLFAQLHAHTFAHHLTIATTVRNALRNYLDHADTITQPPNFQSLLTPDNKAKCNRVRLAGLTINPKRDPDLRDRLEIYATYNQLTMSTVMRRAIYEYTKPTDTNTTPPMHPDPVATIDAWGDGYTPAPTTNNPTNATSNQLTTLRVIVSQPKI